MSMGTVWIDGSWGPLTWETGSWADVSGPVGTIIAPPTPTVLLFESTATTLEFYGDDGSLMSTPVMFTAGTTGPLTVRCVGADGTAEDLSTAILVTLRVVNVNGTVVVNAVPLTNTSSNGTASWNRLGAQVSTAGDYRSQVTVVRNNASVGYYPSAQAGAPLTILPTV